MPYSPPIMHITSPHSSGGGDPGYSSYSSDYGQNTQTESFPQTASYGPTDSQTASYGQDSYPEYGTDSGHGVNSQGSRGYRPSDVSPGYRPSDLSRGYRPSDVSRRDMDSASEYGSTTEKQSSYSYGSNGRWAPFPQDMEKIAQGQVLGQDVEAVGGSASRLDLSDARGIIQQTVNEHALDPNFPLGLLKRATTLLSQERMDPHEAAAIIEEIKVEAALMQDSPYPEVRAVVPNIDDPALPVSTLRAWVVGIILTILGTGINTFFSARQPSITVNTFVGQLLAFPFGKALEALLPDRRILGIDLNPGPFNIKEHMLITIMANVTFGSTGVYSTDIIFVQRMPAWFNENHIASKAGYQILLTLSTQFIGFSVAGLTRRFLVYPPAMIWPANLATIAMNRLFHAPGNPVANGWRITRLKFFLVVFIAYGLFYVFPFSVFKALSTFDWIVWAAPNNLNLRIIAGQSSGMGLLNPIPTFDWSYVTTLNMPLITPLFSTINLTVGALLSEILFTIPMFYSNVWYTSYLPINSNSVFDRFGKKYNVSRIMNADYSVNNTLYEAYSPPYLSAGNAMSYVFFFAIYPATLVYVALHHHREVSVGFRSAISWRSARSGFADVHNRLMAVYPEVPEWWFASILAICFMFGVIVIEVYHTDVPVWTLFFSLAVALVFMIPIGVITAVTNIHVTMNVLAELIGGYALPGRPLANMIFKAFGFITTAQAVGYASDLKLAHYMKLPPRTVFWAQMVASFVASFVGLGVIDWQITNIPDICTAANKDHFTCPGYQTFFTAAVVWGTIGPKRIYSHLYRFTFLGFLFGTLLPIPFWYLARRYPASNWKLVNIPAVLYGGINVSPYNISYLYAGLWPALIVMGYVKRRYLPWWSKYNYVLATALATATAGFGTFWYLTIELPDASPRWWGTDIAKTSMDAQGVTMLKIPDKVNGFGPGPGQFSA